jgi:hypothetical protein
MDKNKAFLLENKLLNYYSHLCNLLMFLLTKTFARSIINGPNLFGKFSKIMKCSYRDPCNSPRWVLDSPKFSHPDESWTHQSFLTQMSPGLTKVFSPRWVLDSPKFSHLDESWTHQSFLTQMSPGLTKVFLPRWVLDSPKFSHPDESWTHQSFLTQMSPGLTKVFKF